MRIDRELAFKSIDQLAEAALLDKLKPNVVPTYKSNSLGPLLEFIHLQKQHEKIRNVGSNWLNTGDYDYLLASINSQSSTWTSFTGRQIGFMRVNHAGRNIDDWTGFSQRAKRAAVSSGLPSDLAGQVVSALDELLSNVLEHSRAPGSGYVAYAQGNQMFEVIVVDEGVGVLNSLKSSADYNHLLDHGDALKQFIKEGVSRFGKDSGRGMGFRPLFRGLANAQCALRFRSGDHALEIDGRELAKAPAELRQTVFIKGLICSINCHHHTPQ